MTRLLNAQLADGELYTLEIQDGYFSEVVKQDCRLAESSNYPPLLSTSSSLEGSETFDAQGSLILPAGIDCHVHSRDPGDSEKETWQSLGKSAFKGGVTAVVDMPNNTPPMLFEENIEAKLARAATTPLTSRFLLGVSKKNIPQINGLLKKYQDVLCGLKIYYGNSTGNLMFDKLEALSKLELQPNQLIVFHCEDQGIIDDNLTKFQKNLDISNPADVAIHSKVRSVESALKATKTVLNWAVDQQRPVHFAHVSSPEELELIVSAKSKNPRISLEVAPHHLLFEEGDYQEKGALLKVNPPIRRENQMQRLQEMFAQGLVDCFATDHAPHLLEEKQSNHYHCAPSGIPTIEFYWPLLFSLSRNIKGLSLQLCMEMACTRPAKLFGFAKQGEIRSGYQANIVLIDQTPTHISQAELISKCGYSPYVGFNLAGTVAKTWLKGVLTYSK